MPAAQDWVCLAFRPRAILPYVTDLPIPPRTAWETFEPAWTSKSEVRLSRRPTFPESPNATLAGCAGFAPEVAITKHMYVMAISDMRIFITVTGSARGYVSVYKLKLIFLIVTHSSSVVFDNGRALT